MSPGSKLSEPRRNASRQPKPGPADGLRQMCQRRRTCPKRRKPAGAQTHGQPACSTTTTFMADQRAIKSQSVRLTASQSRPERRSNDGQPILEPNHMSPEPRSDLVLRVELWGFEPQTSCMHPAATRPPEYAAAGHRPPASLQVSARFRTVAIFASLDCRPRLSLVRYRRRLGCGRLRD